MTSNYELPAEQVIDCPIPLFPWRSVPNRHHHDRLPREAGPVGGADGVEGSCLFR